MNDILTSSARESATRGAPGVVEDVPAGVEEVVVGAGEHARGARLHGLVLVLARGEIHIHTRRTLP